MEELGGKKKKKKKSMNIVNFSPTIRALVFIMIFNLYPMKNLTNLSQPRTLFLHDLYKEKEIGICAHIC